MKCPVCGSDGGVIKFPHKLSAANEELRQAWVEAKKREYEEERGNRADGARQRALPEPQHRCDDAASMGDDAKPGESGGGGRGVVVVGEVGGGAGDAWADLPGGQDYRGRAGGAGAQLAFGIARARAQRRRN